jgi:hypothetical protein
VGRREGTGGCVLVLESKGRIFRRMRASLGVFWAALLLLACSGGASTTGSGGGTGGTAGAATSTSSHAAASSTSGGTGGGCNGCNAVVTQALPRPSLCNNVSAGLYEALQNCACSGGPCGTACDTQVCGTMVPSSACLSCMQTSCASTWGPCSADTSSH